MRAALDAADAGRLVRQALEDPATAVALRAAAAVDVVAAGKAAGPMLHAFELEAGIPLRHVIRVDLSNSAHPVPDERSVAAARRVMDLAAAGTKDDLLVLLLSGGASSLMALPAEGVTLADKQQTSQRLLAHGTPIQALNAVRKHLSAVKGGQLAARAQGAVLTLAVSDVGDDDLSAIGSGPTVADPTSFATALAALDRHGGRERYPAAVVSRLETGARGMIVETPKPGDPRLTRSSARVIGGRHTALEGARAAAEALGYTVYVITKPVTGEARRAGRNLVEASREIVASGPHPLCVLASGETTVHVTGSGKGGRNQECALAMAPLLGMLGTAVVAASIGTDGIDGPTDAAGGVVDTTTLARAQAARLGPIEHYLSDNNAYAYLDALDDLIRTGPTNTNVGDVQVILISSL